MLGEERGWCKHQGWRCRKRQALMWTGKGQVGAGRWRLVCALSDISLMICPLQLRMCTDPQSPSWKFLRRSRLSARALPRPTHRMRPPVLCFLTGCA